MAQWPDAPAVYDPDLATLPSKPSGLVLEALPDQPYIESVTPASANSDYQSAVAAARSALATATDSAETIHGDSVVAAGTNRTNAVGVADAAKQASIDGFSPSSITALQQSVSDAADALQTEKERVSQLEGPLLQQTLMGFDQAHRQADETSQSTFGSASNAAQSDSMGTMMSLEQQRTDAQDQLNLGNLTQSQYDAISASVDADQETESDRVAVEVSGYQETRDNEKVDHDVTESKDAAIATKASADRIADAGHAQEATLRQAKENLAVAQATNQHDRDKTDAEANVQYYKDVADADKVRAHAVADADAVKAAFIRNAEAIRDKAMATADYDRAVATAAATFALATAAVSGESAAAADYRTSMAAADRDTQDALSLATQTQSHAVADADLVLDLVLIEEKKKQTKSDANAGLQRSNAFADAAKNLRINYLTKVKDQSIQAKGFNKDATAKREAAKRDFDKGFASVQKERQAREAEDLKGNRKDIALAQNQRGHGILTEPQYQAERATLNAEAAVLRAGIRQDTFGNPSDAPDGGGSEGGGNTESKVRQDWLGEMNTVTADRLKQTRQHSAELTTYSATLAKTHDDEISQAKAEYKNSLAQAGSPSLTVTAAFSTWIRAVSDAGGRFQSDLADGGAAHAIANAGATSEFYTQAANDFRDSVAAGAAADGENPWSDRLAATSAASAIRIAAVGTAYTSHVTTTASVSADAIGQAAVAQGTLTADTTIATWAASFAAASAATDHQVSLNDSRDTHDSDTSIAPYNAIIAGKVQQRNDTKADAGLVKNAGYFTALLTDIYLGAVGGGGLAREALEAATATTYATAVIDADKTYLTDLADERKKLHDTWATAREIFLNENTDAGKTRALAIADVGKTSAITVHDALSVFTVSLADTTQTRDLAWAGADHAFTDLVSQADQQHSEAGNAANATFDTAIAQRDRDAVATWAAAELDSDGNVRPQAAYSLTVYDAALTWQSGAAPIIQGYQDSIASEIQDLTMDHASAEKTAALERIAADHGQSIDVNTASTTLANDSATELKTEADASIGASATLSLASSEIMKTFADEFATRRKTLETAYATKSAVKEEALLTDRVKLHKDEITSSQYDIRHAENRDFLGIDLAEADRDLQRSLADATEAWGDDFAEKQWDLFDQQASPAQTRRHNAAQDYKISQDEIAQAGADHTATVADITAAHAIDIVEAETDFDNATAAAWTAALADIGGLNVTQSVNVTTTQNAVADAAGETSSQGVTHTQSVMTDLETWVTTTVDADFTRQSSLADTYKTATGQYVTAETDAFRSGADVAFAQAREHFGQTVPAAETSRDALSNQYRQEIAQYRYTLATGRASASGQYGTDLADARKTHADNIATADDTVTIDDAGSLYTLDVSLAGAIETFSLQSADASQGYRQTLAQSDRDHVVDDMGSVATAYGAQYDAAKSVYQSFDDILDADVKLAIAQVEGADAYADSILPAMVSTQTDIADGNLAYANDVIDDVHTFRTTAAGLVHGGATADAARDRDEVVDRSGARKTVITTTASATSIFDSAQSGAYTVYNNTVALIRRDAQLAGETPDGALLAGARTTMNETIAAAQTIRTTATQTAREDYFGSLATLTHDREDAVAESDYGVAESLLDAYAELMTETANAALTADGVQVDADHDYQIADIDAVIDGLTAVRAGFQSSSTILALNNAQSSRGDRVADVNADRLTDHNANVTRHTDRLDEIADDKAEALALADSAREARKSRADGELLYAGSSAAVPSVGSYDAVTLGVTAVVAPLVNGGLPQSLVSRVTTSLTFGGHEYLQGSGSMHGGTARRVGAVADGVFYGTGIRSAGEMGKFVISTIDRGINEVASLIPHGTTVWEMYKGFQLGAAQTVIDVGSFIANDPLEALRLAGHFTLDVIGLIPGWGIAADLANGAWYAYEGDKLNAGLSFAAAVPGLGYVASGTKYFGKAATRIYKGAKALDIGINLSQSAVGVIQGVRNGSVLQVGMGLAGGAINARSFQKGFDVPNWVGGKVPTNAPNPGAHISPITGRAVDLSGRIRQVKPANGPTRFTPVRQNGNPVAAGMDHVRARHYGGTNSQSQFSIASDELSSILQSRVVREAPLQQIGSGRQAMWSRDVNVGRIVGRTRVADGANPTSTLRVFVDEAGNLITTFPVPGT